MFESANLPELARLAQSVITAKVVSGSKSWHLNDDIRQKIRAALFGRHKPDSAVAVIPPHEQKELLDQFSQCVAAPVIQLLPAETAAFAVLVLYEEFVNTVFIDPVMESDVGTGD